MPKSLRTEAGRWVRWQAACPRDPQSRFLATLNENLHGIYCVHSCRLLTILQDEDCKKSVHHVFHWHLWASMYDEPKERFLIICWDKLFSRHARYTASAGLERKCLCLAETKPARNATRELSWISATVFALIGYKTAVSRSHRET